MVSIEGSVHIDVLEVCSWVHDQPPVILLLGNGMISFSGRRSFPPTGFHSGIFVGTVTVASIQISANHFTDKPPRTIGRAMRR